MTKYFVTKSSISFVKHLSTKNALCHFSHPRPIAKSIPTKIIFHYLNVFTNEIKNFIEGFSQQNILSTKVNIYIYIYISKNEQNWSEKFISSANLFTEKIISSLKHIANEL